MFGTLHCKSYTKEAEFVERPHGSLDPEKTSACDRCRAKKVISYIRYCSQETYSDRPLAAYIGQM